MHFYMLIQQDLGLGTSDPLCLQALAATAQALDVKAGYVFSVSFDMKLPIHYCMVSGFKLLQ